MIKETLNKQVNGGGKKEGQEWAARKWKLSSIHVRFAGLLPQ
jgi:hypothetical protein